MVWFGLVVEFGLVWFENPKIADFWLENKFHLKIDVFRREIKICLKMGVFGK